MRSACETGSGRFRARRIAMLYGAYEFQRSMLAGASAMAGFGAELLNNPANPFAYFGGGPVMGSALEVFAHRSEEHTSELQSLMRISYAVFCLKKKKQKKHEDIYQRKLTYLQ